MSVGHVAHKGQLCIKLFLVLVFLVLDVLHCDYTPSSVRHLYTRIWIRQVGYNYCKFLNYLKCVSKSNKLKCGS